MKTIDYAKFGQQVFKHRIMQGWTQEKLATEAGISTPFLGHIERGTRKPSVETLVALANALRVGVDELLGDSLEYSPAHSDPAYLELLNQFQTLRQEIKNRWND